MTRRSTAHVNSKLRPVLPCSLCSRSGPKIYLQAQIMFNMITVATLQQGVPLSS
jgi:hypothetical protein